MPELVEAYRFNRVFLGRLLVAALIAVLVSTILTFGSLWFAMYVDGQFDRDAWNTPLFDPDIWAIVLLFAVVMGTPGAMVFLGAAFWLRPNWLSYPLTGLLVGAAHSLAGIAMRLAWGADVNDAGLQWWITLLGGFALAYFGEGLMLSLLVVAAMTGGWLAGAYFGKGVCTQ